MVLTEWTVTLQKDETSGAITAALYSIDWEGNYDLVATESFGPFDTALDICTWLTRHWAPRAKLLMR